MYNTIIDFLNYNTHWNTKLVSSIEKIGGLSSNNYKVIYDKKPYFIKICTHTYLHTDRITESDVLTKVSSKNISPYIYYFSKESGNMICRWIDGKMPSLADFESREFLYKLSFKLKELHSLECKKVFNPFFDIKERLKLCINLNLPLPSSIDILINKLDLLENKLIKTQLLGLCHNDLNSSNILLNKENLYFVDFEYSCMGDVFFDLAAISWFFTENSRRELLFQYFGCFRDEDYEKLLDYLFVVKFYNATWSLLKSVDSNSDYDYLISSKIIFDDLLKHNSIRNF